MAETPPPVVVVVFTYNEHVKLRTTLDRFTGHAEWDVWVMDDGSTDGSTGGLEEEYGCRVLRHERNRGAGAAVRTAFDALVQSSYRVAVLAAGNDKDRPEDVMALARPILEGQADLVVGSRYLPGGELKNTPLYRQVATRFVHPTMFWAVSGRRLTDTTNGYRAVSRHILEDDRVDLSDPRLDQYELEPYFLYRAIKLGYRVIERPVRKIYPDRKLGYTKMKPITGWWSILRPLVYIGLRVWD